MKTYWDGGSKLHTFLTSALDRGEGSVSLPGSFTPGEVAPGTHCIRGWMGHKAGQNAVAKRKTSSLALPGIEPRSSNP
jgi:hypothetical protein